VICLKFKAGESHDQRYGRRRQPGIQKARIFTKVRTICHRDAAGRHAYAYRERQSRGSDVSQTDNNNDDDSHNDDENDINDSHNDDHVDDHDVFLSGSVDFARDEPPSDGSDRATSHDDRLDGFDEIVSAQLSDQARPRESGCSTRTEISLGNHVDRYTNARASS
jgi:hypothetical protein